MAGEVVRDPVNLTGGVLHLTDAPGLGATIDPDALKRYHVER
jgi:L-alanine-DL-glutamate epimerase-like enolase superfamily enzyme